MKKKFGKTGFFPPSNICRDFLWLSDNVSAQEAIDLLCSFYGVSKLKIEIVTLKELKAVKGLKKPFIAFYDPKKKRRPAKAYFTKYSFKNHWILHEFFHHLVASGIIEMDEKFEEKTADRFAKEIMARVKLLIV